MHHNIYSHFSVICDNTSGQFHNFSLLPPLQENGYLVMVYDIGNGERRLVEKGRKFDDGQYHYVSFVRTGANATMRVDDFPRQYYKQPGR